MRRPRPGRPRGPHAGSDTLAGPAGDRAAAADTAAGAATGTSTGTRTGTRTGTAIRGGSSEITGFGTDAELRALRVARRTLMLQIAAVIAVVIAALGTFAYHLEASRQNAQIQETLNFAVGQDSTAEISPCQWVFVLHDGVVQSPRQYPAGLPLKAPMLATAASGISSQTSLSKNGTVYAVLTAEGPDGVHQAVFDTRYQRQDLHNLLMALITVELVGIAVSVLIGWVLAHRSLTPLGRALAKQRRFVADASHELRTPLTRLHTRTQLLLRAQRGRLPADVVAELEQLVHGTRELGEVVEDLLLSASLRPGEARPDRVDLGAITAAVAEAERPRAREHALSITVQRPPGPAEVLGLESPLRRMVSALLDNAIGHTGPGGNIALSVRTADRGRTVELSVCDDGAGFDPADGSRIFERFARGGAGQGRRFGLGLALVREIVQSHGGTIEAVSNPGRGACFTVRIPAVRGTRRGGGGGTASVPEAAEPVKSVEPVKSIESVKSVEVGRTAERTAMPKAEVPEVAGIARAAGTEDLGTPQAPRD